MGKMRLGLFLLGAVFALPSTTSAEDKKKTEEGFTSYYDSVETIYTPEIGVIRTARLGDIIYMETSQPVSLTFINKNELTIPFEGGAFVLPAETRFISIKRYGEIIYCFSVYKGSDLPIPTGNHCVWDQDGDQVPDFYRLWVWGADDYTDTLALEPNTFTAKNLANELKFKNGSIKIEDKRSFSFEKTTGKKIKLGYANDSENQFIGAVFLGTFLQSSDSPRNIRKLISLKYKNEEVTYLIGGMEITILDLDGETLTFRIDKPLTSRVSLNPEQTGFGITWTEAPSKAKRKK